MRSLGDQPSWRRRGAVAGVAFVGVMSSALPAFAHASFPASAALGFAPNPAGGTGAAGTTSPYAANTAVTIWARVPYEQTEPANGATDTTVDVKIIVPDGWTNASCGAAVTAKVDATTLGTPQPGTAVTGWSCEILTVNNRKVLHYHGPQVGPTQSEADSAQFFSVPVTTPSPTAQTTYNGVKDSGTEGFIIDQVYASGETEHWIPSADFVGTLPPGVTTGTVASGLVRTVAAVGTVPPPPPASAGASQTISATVGAATEEFTMTIPANPGINMTAGPVAANFAFTAALNPITIKDTRSSKPAWSASGQVANFTPNNVNGKYLGWTPKVISAGAGAVAGAAVPSGITTGNGLRTSSVLASAPAGHAIGAASVGADLVLNLPLDTPPGSYTTTLTITAI
jgi:hypothetical protein